MRVLAIDPGTTQSGWVIYDSVARRPLTFGIHQNEQIIGWLPCTKDKPHADLLAIEHFAAMGMLVGQEVFDTCVWVGRFVQAWHTPSHVWPVLRRDEKLQICADSRAKDKNIRQGLIDMLGAPGTAKNPGPTYGVTSHVWSALAVAVTAAAMYKETAK